MRIVEDPLNWETIQAITKHIVERFEPEQVIQFGSCARGEEDEHSDLDLMVVLRHNNEQDRDGYAIRLAIAENFVLPVDIVRWSDGQGHTRRATGHKRIVADLASSQWRPDMEGHKQVQSCTPAYSAAQAEGLRLFSPILSLTQIY